MLKRTLSIFLIFLMGGLWFPNISQAQTSIELFTPYTGISATPGETIEYEVDLINNTSSIQSVKFSMEGLPENWDYNLTSGSWDIQELAVKPDEPQSFTLEVTLPLKIAKGTYSFTLVASGNGLQTELPLQVTVTEEGTFESILEVDQPNMQGDADATFSYTATLENRTSEEQRYALSYEGPKGWDVVFSVDGQNVTSVVVQPDSSEDIDIEIHPPQRGVKAGTYKFTIIAESGATKATTTVEAVVTGSYSMELTTPTERLSTDITAGDEKTIELLIKNTGTAPLRNIELDASEPTDWEVSFEPQTIQKIAPGESKTVQATIKAADSAIAGDYVIDFSASSDEASAEVKYRVTVETSLIWGWIGILIIAAVLGGVYYLFRTYGRR